ncbi:MAG TPA: hypothetical protein VIF63_00200 [Candidatus Limnocylindrales bacterium]
MASCYGFLASISARIGADWASQPGVEEGAQPMTEQISEHSALIERAPRRRGLRRFAVVFAVFGLLTLAIGPALAHHSNRDVVGASNQFVPNFDGKAGLIGAADLDESEDEAENEDATDENEDATDEDATDESENEDATDENDQGEDEDAQGEDEDADEDADEDDGDEDANEDANDDDEDANEDDGDDDEDADEDDGDHDEADDDGGSGGGSDEDDDEEDDD